MKHIAQLLLPVYQAAAHYGATPVAYPRRTVEAFERAAMARCTSVQRHKAELLSPDTGPGGTHIYLPRTVYTVAYDDRKALGEIVGLALETHGLTEVLVEQIGVCERGTWNSEDAANVAEGLD